MTSPWTVVGDQALLNAKCVKASLDLAKPSQGLSELSLYKKSFPSWRIFQISPAQPAHLEPPEETYIRGNDLVVTYQPNDHQPLCRQVYWKSLWDVERSVCGVEAVLSQQTPLLHSDPTTVISSKLGAGELLSMTSTDSAEFALVSRLEQQNLAGTQASGLLLLRPEHSDMSYVQFVAASDFNGVLIEATQDGGWKIAYRLFTRPIEKGVIRRGRIRGLFVPRASDEKISLACYKELATSEPPLAT